VAPFRRKDDGSPRRVLIEAEQRTAEIQANAELEVAKIRARAKREVAQLKLQAKKQGASARRDPGMEGTPEQIMAEAQQRSTAILVEARRQIDLIRAGVEAAYPPVSTSGTAAAEEP
jgi:5-deoxy-D-glucuronate isomerase